MKNQVKIIIICVLILVGFVYAYDIGEIKTSINNINLGKNSCPEGIIPEKITLIEGTIDNYWSHYSGKREYKLYSGDKEIVSTWDDGSKIIVPDPLYFKNYCRKGESIGENKNHYYCSNLKYDNLFEEIDKEGNIIKKNHIQYIVNFELKSLGEIVFIEEKRKLIPLEEVGKPRLNITGEAWAAEDKPESLVTAEYFFPIYANYSVVSSSCK